MSGVAAGCGLVAGGCSKCGLVPVVNAYLLHRYQLVSGVVEGRIIDKVFSNVAFQSAASTLVRTGNTYLGIH